MARRKMRARDLRKQRWAGIVAAILAFAMIASLAGVYLTQTMWGGESALQQQRSEPQPEDYFAYYQAQVDRLEDYLAGHEATEAVLLELIENYRYLSFVQQVFFDNQDAVAVYEGRLAELSQELVALDPSNLQYRLELANVYFENREEELAEQEVEALVSLLRETPAPLVHLSLVGLLSSVGKDELMQEEALWLYDYLEEKIDQGLADNSDRLYYAVLLGEYLDQPQAAEAIVSAILDDEDEDSSVYHEALNYMNYLKPESENDDNSTE